MSNHTDFASDDFKLGENYMLFRLQKCLEGASDNIQVAVRTLKFIQDEVGIYNGNLRKRKGGNNERQSRKHDTSKTV